MHIICTDGTTIQCRDFEAIDSGVLFFQETAVRREGDEEDEAEEAELGSADGFVPIQAVRFVLPDEMVGAGAGAQRAGVPEPQGAPPAGQRAGGMTQQQGTGGQQGTPQRRGPGPGAQ